MPDAQTDFDWLVPTTKELLRTDECARYLGRSLDFVDALIAEGKLEYLAPTDRQVERKRITRRSLLVEIARQFRGDPTAHTERVLATLSTLDATGLARVIAEATKRRTHLLNRS